MPNKKIALVAINKDKTRVGGAKTNNRVCKKINIYDMIDTTTYTRLPSGKTTVCEVVLKNGFCITGVTSCVDINNYDERLAKELSFKDAENKLYEIAAYSLCSELAKTQPKSSYKVVDETSSKDLIYKHIAIFISDFIKNHINNTFDTNVSKGIGRDSPEMKSIILSSEKELYEDVIDTILWFITRNTKIDELSYKMFIADVKTMLESYSSDIYSKTIFENSRSFVNYVTSRSEFDQSDLAKLMRNATIERNPTNPFTSSSRLQVNILSFIWILVPFEH